MELILSHSSPHTSASCKDQPNCWGLHRIALKAAGCELQVCTEIYVEQHFEQSKVHYFDSVKRTSFPVFATACTVCSSTRLAFKFKYFTFLLKKNSRGWQIISYLLQGNRTFYYQPLRAETTFIMSNLSFYSVRSIGTTQYMLTVQANKWWNWGVAIV